MLKGSHKWDKELCQKIFSLIPEYENDRINKKSDIKNFMETYFYENIGRFYLYFKIELKLCDDLKKYGQISYNDFYKMLKRQVQDLINEKK